MLGTRRHGWSKEGNNQRENAEEAEDCPCGSGLNMVINISGVSKFGSLYFLHSCLWFDFWSGCWWMGCATRTNKPTKLPRVSLQCARKKYCKWMWMIAKNLECAKTCWKQWLLPVHAILVFHTFEIPKWNPPRLKPLLAVVVVIGSSVKTTSSMSIPGPNIEMFWGLLILHFSCDPGTLPYNKQFEVESENQCPLGDQNESSVSSLVAFAVSSNFSWIRMSDSSNEDCVVRLGDWQIGNRAGIPRKPFSEISLLWVTLTVHSTTVVWHSTKLAPKASETYWKRKHYASDIPSHHLDIFYLTSYLTMLIRHPIWIFCHV